MCDLAGAGSRKVLVRGGGGGGHMTNNCNGLSGERAVFVLTLKTIADIGLVGYVSLVFSSSIPCGVCVRCGVRGVAYGGCVVV